MKKPEYWENACSQLADTDNILAKLIQRYNTLTIQSRGNAFETLLRSIIGQQVSVKSADAVWNKFTQKFTPTKKNATKIIQATDEELRSCGFSRQKIAYVKNIAEFVDTHEEDYWQQTDPATMQQDLLAIKGVGKWTWQMFAMFYLNLPDELPMGDLGIIKAIKELYTVESAEEIVEMSEKWRPYRTVACWFLWRYLDDEPIQY